MRSAHRDSATLLTLWFAGGWCFPQTSTPSPSAASLLGGVAVEKERKDREGKERIEYSAFLNGWNLRLFSYQNAQTHEPECKAYGDFALGCDFVPGWYWSNEVFLSVSMDGAPVFCRLPFNKARLLQRDPRGVLSLSWKARPAGESAKVELRFVVFPGDDQLYVEVKAVGWEPKKPLVLDGVCYPNSTSVYPPYAHRTRWVKSATKAGAMADGKLAPFAPETEWALLYHNTEAQETGGCTLVYLPAEIAEVGCAGTYGIGTRLTAKAGVKAVHLAFGEFADQHYSRGSEVFFARSPAIRQRLETMVWTVPPDAYLNFARAKRDAGDMLTVPALQANLGAEWAQICERLQPLIKAAQSPAEWETKQSDFYDAADECSDLLRRMYAAWVAVASGKE